jgi:TorA maturation chaperone TorD
VHDQALARSHAYGLLSQLFQHGPTPDLLSLVRSIPELAAVLPESLEPDEMAAAYQRLFGFNVFPFESIFLGMENLLGGPVTDGVAASYRRMGFHPNQADLSGDHVGVELALLSFLCGAEADALEDNQPDEARRMERLQQNFLDEHLLCWLPALAQSIRQQVDDRFLPRNEPGSQFFIAVAELTLAVVLSHRDELTGAGFASEIRFELPASPRLLDNDQTRLADIAKFLITPAFSGIYLSRDDIGRLAQRGGLPRGFGDRQTMLVNVLRSAAKYDQLTDLLDSLKLVVKEWREMYASSPVADHAFMRPIAKAWLEKLGRTAALLGELETIIQALQTDQP